MRALVIDNEILPIMLWKYKRGSLFQAKSRMLWVIKVVSCVHTFLDPLSSLNITRAAEF